MNYEEELKESNLKLYFFDKTDSTNTRAREIAKETNDDFLVVAQEQTFGRGRSGNSFYSPKGNLYFTLSLKVKNKDASINTLTSRVAVAVHRAILSVAGINTKIKWVNDLYFNDRKICGILCEALSYNNEMRYLIGVGINSQKTEFPDSIKDKAGYILINEENRAKTVLQTVKEIYKVIFDESYIDELRDFSYVLGQDVEFTQNGVFYTGKALEIDQDCALHVNTGMGEMILKSGEISVKVKK